METLSRNQRDKKVYIRIDNTGGKQITLFIFWTEKIK